MAMTIKRGKAATAGTERRPAIELRESFERKTRERLGMTGDEFLRRLDEGTLPNTPAVDEIAILVGEE